VCGYSQLPSIDFTESYAPVMNDVSFRIILNGMMVWNLKAKIIDIETTFLHSDLEESIFREIPSGMEVGNGKCLVKRKTINRFVHSARQFYVKIFKAIKSCGFTGSWVDPCLWVKQSNSEIVMMEIYAGDCLTIESDEDIKEVIEDLKRNELGIKIENTFKTT
jgi:hypothetical protein